MSELIEWFNLNSNRNFPFAEDHSMLSLDGARFPNELVADLGMLCAYSSDSEHACLLSWSVTSAAVTLVFARGTTPVAYCMALLADLTNPYTEMELTPINSLASGKITLGKPSSIYSSGQHSFSLAPLVEARAVRYAIAPALLQLSRTVNGTPLTGIVKLQYDPTLMSASVSGTDTDPILTFTLLKPGDFTSPCQSTASAGRCPQGSPLRSINNTVKGTAISIVGCTVTSPQPVTVEADPSIAGLVEVNTTLQRSVLCAGRTRKLPDPLTGKVPNYPDVNPTIYEPSTPPVPPVTGCAGLAVANGSILINGAPPPAKIAPGTSVAINVTATPSGITCMNYSVDCGDGTVVSGQTAGPTFAVSHAWSHTGTYTVVATLNNDTTPSPVYASVTVHIAY